MLFRQPLCSVILEIISFSPKPSFKLFSLSFGSPSKQAMKSSFLYVLVGISYNHKLLLVIKIIVFGLIVPLPVCDNYPSIIKFYDVISCKFIIELYLAKECWDFYYNKWIYIDYNYFIYID